MIWFFINSSFHQALSKNSWTGFGITSSLVIDLFQNSSHTMHSIIIWHSPHKFFKKLEKFHKWYTKKQVIFISKISVQTPPKCTILRLDFQKFSGGHAPGPP